LVTLAFISCVVYEEEEVGGNNGASGNSSGAGASAGTTTSDTSAATGTPGACDANPCMPGQICNPDGTCSNPGAGCTPDSCGKGQVCDQGKCVADGGKPGPGPGPTCAAMPQRDCTDSAAECGKLYLFEPMKGPGYELYPLNGQSMPNNMYRSYLRRDLMMLTKWASAMVDCKAKNWSWGNSAGLFPGDMSEANGAIPGTSVGQPGHPKGTHTNGYDMDVGYYQLPPSKDNKLRPVCAYTVNGKDQYHCLGEPTLLDKYRTALYLGLLFTSPRVRVIGVDGKVGPAVIQAMTELCNNGWLQQAACTAAKKGLAYETEDKGAGWYYFHHHHFHVSLKQLAGGSSPMDVAPPPNGGEDYGIEPLIPGSLPHMSWLGNERERAGHACAHEYVAEGLTL
jgi:hypothetical protein